MAVLNLHHLKGILPPNAVYIGRASARYNLPSSVFANPFPVNPQAPREQVVERFREWLQDGLSTGRFTEKQLLELEGKDLVCYCAPKACHGHVLERAAAWAGRRRDAGLTGSPVMACPSPRAHKPFP